MVKAVIFDMYETLITLLGSPAYFGTQMAIDAGIAEDEFQELWKPMETARTTGEITLEAALKVILEKCKCYSDELYGLIIQKRITSRQESFNHLNPQIIPLLSN